MGRTQVYLTDEELELLDARARETGASRSELVRRAVRAHYGAETPRPPLTIYGVAPSLAIDPEDIDAELAKIYEERARRWR